MLRTIRPPEARLYVATRAEPPTVPFSASYVTVGTVIVVAVRGDGDGGEDAPGVGVGVAPGVGTGEGRFAPVGPALGTGEPTGSTPGAWGPPNPLCVTKIGGPTRGPGRISASGTATTSTA